ncbi:hypothetical protein Q7C36_021443 [Tachysurus vachellii]|uniref:Uncharacterized protein n=1 Tax=Tachysurus vachellii TaxID=175792 RepID=A0AA88LKK5_TACVA|nr:hypothetical protein Q7C36_021443 [Tachysurus vachellii]
MDTHIHCVSKGLSGDEEGRRGGGGGCGGGGEETKVGEIRRGSGMWRWLNVTKLSLVMIIVSSERLMAGVKIAHSCFTVASVLQGMHLLGFPPGGSLPVSTVI